MTEFQRIRLVAEREIIEYARQPSYRNGTIITCVLLLAAVAAASFFPRWFGGPDEVTIGFLPEAAAVVDAAVLQADPDAFDLEVLQQDDRTAAEARVVDGDLDVLLVDGEQVVVAEELRPALGALLQSSADTARLAAELGTDPQSALAASRVPLQVAAIDPGDPAETQRRVLTLTGLFLALGQVIGGAFVLANGLVEEKASRVVEVIVAKARPRTLLAGKIVGFYVVLTAQLLVFVAVGLGAVAVSPDLSVPEGLPAVTLSVLAWYSLAFVIFSALFSIAAALSSRQEDMALKLQPMMYLVFAAFGGAFFASANPTSVVSQALSFVPFTAPAVIPARQVAGAVAGWEIAVAVVVTLAAAWGAVRFAGRVYTGGALRTRGTATIRTVLADGEA